MNRQFSIVIPLYNKEQQVALTLESVLTQTHDDFEIVVVEDGSTDRSAEVVQSIRDRRIRLVRQPNAGVSQARNKGIEMAKYDYIAFLDADDFWKPEFLSIINRLIDKYPDAGLYCTNYIFKTGPNSWRKPNLCHLPDTPDALLDNYFQIGGSGDLLLSSSCSSCIPKKVLRETGGFPEGEKLGEDQEVWINIALKYPYAFTRQIAAIYCVDDDNRATVRNIPVEELPFSKRLQRRLDGGEVPPYMRRWVQKYIASHLIYIGSMNVRTGNYSTARQLLLDLRCLQHPIRQLGWLGMSYIRQITRLLGLRSTRIITS
jgi:glycosyltransferase involved in cell wall biosynthesis